ncbi:hypothetical protein KVR01_000609 [Diaporthe batatas]|uniref:uncharacterized protein n=1 Tax=Diaporthe batatas TaxID=748121 RepID=UPI001D03D78C|nr:uncharacterized protein KVR01_000609 [Diaporthe batatas]KAG8169864.1 hypothetical protein KVR01_000609 [Diaporthe batatas]
MVEKPVVPPPTRFNAVGFCLTAIRIWQWSSSFFVYASFSLLYAHIQNNRLGENGRMRGVQVLGLVSLAYSTVVLCCVHVFKTLGLRTWRLFAVMSVPSDLTIMGINLAKITILAYSGLPADCHGLTRDKYSGNDLVRQPSDGFTTIRFGTAAEKLAGELDALCTFPRTVYGLSTVAIFSYTFSILLSVLYLQQHGASTAADSEKQAAHGPAQVESQSAPSSRPGSIRSSGAASRHPSFLGRGGPYDPSRPPSPGSIRSAAPSYHSRAPSHGQPRWAPHQDAATPTDSSTDSTGSRSRSSSSAWDVTTLASDADSIRSGISLPDTDSVVSGGSLPPPPLPGSPAPAPRRWSTSTSSSYDANAFVVTDGFRPGGSHNPPEYSSRPGSLYHETVKYDAGLGLPGGPAP